jgi:diaminopimelate decarboxylase
VIGGRDVRDLADRLGTPFYVYDAGQIRKNYKRAARALPDFRIAFSLKANPNLCICAILRRCGSLAEVASGGEILAALASGFHPREILFAGPAKQDWELELACRRNIGTINVESLGELERLNTIAQSLGLRARVCIRVNTREGSRDAVEKMAGGSSRFGIDEELVSSALRFRTESISVVGIHVYTGSQILDEDEIVSNIVRSVRLFVKCSHMACTPLKSLICGGGFGVSNQARQPALDLTYLRKRLTSRLMRYAEPLRTVRLTLELGRYLVAAAGVFVTRVVDVKTSRGKIYVSTDGGMNNFLRPVFMRVEHPIFAVNRLDQPLETSASMGGPLCTPLDLYGTSVPLPPISTGDLVGIFNAGAYGFTMSTHGFLSHPVPPEAIVDKGKIVIVRKRVGIQKMIRMQRAEVSPTR